MTNKGDTNFMEIVITMSFYPLLNNFCTILDKQPSQVVHNNQ